MRNLYCEQNELSNQGVRDVIEFEEVEVGQRRGAAHKMDCAEWDSDIPGNQPAPLTFLHSQEKGQR